uniref:MutS homolog 5 n=1 Tax=Homo sapiens TaxID=9606 RepID=A0A140TA06_HUMAN
MPLHSRWSLLMNLEREPTRWMGSRFWPLCSDTGWHVDPHAPTSLWPPTF